MSFLNSEKDTRFPEAKMEGPDQILPATGLTTTDPEGAVAFRNAETLPQVHGCQMAIAGYFRIVCVWPFGLLDYGSAMLRCKI